MEVSLTCANVADWLVRCWAAMSCGGHEFSTAPSQGRARPSLDAARSATACWSRTLALALTGAVRLLLPPRRLQLLTVGATPPLSVLPSIAYRSDCTISGVPN